jgi:hypothetical protein
VTLIRGRHTALGSALLFLLLSSNALAEDEKQAAPAAPFTPPPIYSQPQLEDHITPPPIYSPQLELQRSNEVVEHEHLRRLEEKAAEEAAKKREREQKTR